MTVLVVDDEPLMGASLARALSGHEVILATTAEAAMACLEEGTRVDVVLTDLGLPGASGVDLFHWITAHYPSLARRVAFMTGSPSHPLAARARETPATVFQKPFTLEQIRREVARLASLDSASDA